MQLGSATQENYTMSDKECVSYWLSPGTFANLKTVRDQPQQLRDRLR